MSDISTISKDELVGQLEALGVQDGDTLMVHVSLRALGPVGGGPPMLLEALCDCIGPTGNVMAYVSWCDSPYEETLGALAVPNDLLNSWPAFDPAVAPAYPGFGAFNDFIIAHPRSRRSNHPDASMSAIGPKADYLLHPHPMDSAYGPGSPIERLLELNGKVVLIGAGPDAVTVLHYAEAIARISNKRRVQYWMPLLEDGRRRWLSASDWDSNGILDEYAQEGEPDAVERITRDYLELKRHRQGQVGRAHASLIDANDIVHFGVDWLETRHAVR